MNGTIRRGDRGLGKTASGGNKGSFASHERQAASPPTVQDFFETNNLSVGGKSPWGEIDHVRSIATGMDVVDTAGHGGVKLTPERNRLIPAPLRNRSGWYEEDCEASIVSHTFPEEFAASRLWPHKNDADEWREDSAHSVRMWFPDQWEKATGEKVTAEQSRIVAEREWKEAHAGQPIVTSAVTSDTNPDWVRVTAKLDGSEAEYLVPKDEYRDGRQPGFAVDPARHPKLPPIPANPYERKDQTYALPAVDDVPLTDAARRRVMKDLGQRYRLSDGSVMTLRQIVEEGGVLERLEWYDADSGRTQYRVARANRTVLPVSKATFQFLEQVPDGTSDNERARGALSRAERKLREANQAYETAARRGDWDVRELREKAERARRQQEAALEVLRNTPRDEQSLSRDIEQAEWIREQTAIREREALSRMD